MEKTFEIDIKRLVTELLYKCWIIILAAMVFAIGGYAYAKTKLVPRYTASVSLYVNNYDSDMNGEKSKVNNADLYTSQALVQTYLTFLTTDRVLDEVALKLEERYTVSQLRGMIGASVMNDTEIFNVSITSTNPEESAKIANIVAEMAPSVITEYVEGSSVKVVDYAKVPTTRSFPVYRKYVMMGFIAGGGLAAIIIVLMVLFNSKVTTEEEIEKMFTAPVIGKIPNFEQTHTQHHSYKYGYKSAYKQEYKDKE